MEELEMLGYKTPNTVKHHNGIEITIPEDKESSEWCVHVPSSLIRDDEYFNNGFTYYNVPYWQVVNIVFKYSNKEERDNYLKLRDKRYKERNSSAEPSGKSRWKVKTPKKKHPYYDDVMEYRAEGMTYREIAEKVGYSYQTIYNIVNSK